MLACAFCSAWQRICRRISSISPIGSTSLTSVCEDHLNGLLNHSVVGANRNNQAIENFKATSEDVYIIGGANMLTVIDISFKDICLDARIYSPLNEISVKESLISEKYLLCVDLCRTHPSVGVACIKSYGTPPKFFLLPSS
jgi:hypothetical protein